MHSADRDLAARDPALPALGVLLDDAALGGWLADHAPAQTLLDRKSVV